MIGNGSAQWLPIGEITVTRWFHPPAGKRMLDERFGISVHPDYTSALGLAVYCFASLEWNAVRCCERLEPGSIDGLEERTAGRVADTLLHLVKRLAVSEQQTALQGAAADFRFLVGTRNNLVHARPGTTPDGMHGLFRHGDHWTIAELQGVADAFAACSLRFDTALRSELLQPAGPGPA
jgi:hypothetical protein